MFVPGYHFSSKLLEILTKGSRQGGSDAPHPTDGDGNRAESVCTRDAASPAQMLPPAPAPPSSVKNERSSPQDSTISRSPSASPSGSSYPSSTPERVSPLAPPVPPPRHYSEIMRTLAARYNNGSSDYFQRLNGCGLERPPPSPQIDVASTPTGGLFSKMHHGGPHMPAYPTPLDMNATKTLFDISRLVSRGRSRRKGLKKHQPDHCPLDLSTAGDVAAKRTKPSTSPSSRSDVDDRLTGESGEGRDCLCAEARARLSAMTVDEVRCFVGSIDICAEYAANFHEQRIDGSGLPLLTEEHLTGMLQMKLGPALKLRAAVAKRLEPCAQCQASSAANAPKLNGTAFKPEPRSNTTSPS